MPRPRQIGTDDLARYGRRIGLRRQAIGDQRALRRVGRGDRILPSFALLGRAGPVEIGLGGVDRLGLSRYIIPAALDDLSPAILEAVPGITADPPTRTVGRDRAGRPSPTRRNPVATDC